MTESTLQRNPYANAAENARIYMDTVDTGIMLLLAGIRQRMPDADPQVELRKVLDAQSEDHTRSIIHMLEELSRRERQRLGITGDRRPDDDRPAPGS